MGISFMQKDRADLLSVFVLPLLKPKTNKSFDLKMIDELLFFKPEKEEDGERIVEQTEQEYIFDDEIEESRMQNNFYCFLKCLFPLLLIITSPLNNLSIIFRIMTD